MYLPNVPSEEDGYKLARKTADLQEVREAELVWLCGLIDHGNDLADKIQPHLAEILDKRGIRHFRFDIRKGMYVLDDPSDIESNRWRTMEFPEAVPYADVIVGINDISITGQTSIGFRIEALRRGIIPVTCVYEDKNGTEDVCIRPNYSARISPTDYLRRFYPRNFKELADRGLIPEVVKQETYLHNSPVRHEVTL